MKIVFLFVLLIGCRLFAAEPSDSVEFRLLAAKSGPTVKNQNRSVYDENSDLAEDSTVILQILENILIDAQKKSQRTEPLNWSSVKPMLVKGAFKLAQTKLWLVGINNSLIFQYPEVIIIDQILRIIRATTLYPTLIATGNAQLIPFCPFLPDIEIMDKTYLTLRQWLARKAFKYKFKISMAEVDQFKLNLIHQNWREDIGLDNLAEDPAFVRAMLTHVPKDFVVSKNLQSWIEKFFQLPEASGFSPEISIVLATEALILRAELEVELRDVSFGFRELISPVRIKQWLNLFSFRRRITAQVTDVKGLQRRYLVSLLVNRPEDIASEFQLKRQSILGSVKEYRERVAQFETKSVNAGQISCQALLLTAD